MRPFQKLHIHKAPPLRIKELMSKRYLISPSNRTHDSLEVEILDDIVACFHAISEGNCRDRKFLYSRGENKHLVTATGYDFTGCVEVYSWKKANSKFQDWIEDEQEQKEIELLELVEFHHVQSNGTIDNFLETHKSRIESIDAYSLSLQEAVSFYRLMGSHVSNG